ncbi:MraY family glycosyltransferase [Draconibacterium sp.]|uniref:MraY family glycosyltransferase n=1 Tax=Draconibacterium sp. TaxID=1965318 RepID=UPI003567EE00
MEIILILSALILGFLLVLIAVPPIIRIAKSKHLFEPFEERKIHTKVVPPLGGVAIFIAFTLSAIFATDGLEFTEFKYILAGVILMFFTGLKDDLIIISARKKLIIQIVAVILLISFANIHFTNLHGVLGEYRIGHITGISLSLFAMIVIINAFNLIDGVDGLASGIGTLASLVFGTWFYLTGNYPIAIMAFALVGALAAFFIYNVFGNSNKLFMGDTGSLIIGFLISVMVVSFNELNLTAPEPYRIVGAPAVSFAIIIVPLIDTLRVMTIRIAQRRSPFSPDKNHIHHRLLSLLHSHLKVTSTILAGNLVLIVIALGLNYWQLNVNLQFVIIFLVGLGLSMIPSYILRTKRTKKAYSS